MPVALAIWPTAGDAQGAGHDRDVAAGRPPPAGGRAGACGRIRAARPGPGCAPPGWRSPAAAPRRRMVAADQLAHQPVGEVLEVVQALAQVGVGRAQHAGAVSDCTRSTAASAVRPVSRLRAGGAASRGHGRTCGRFRAPRDARRRRRSRRAPASRRDRTCRVSTASSRRLTPCCTSSAMNWSSRRAARAAPHGRARCRRRPPAPRDAGPAGRQLTPGLGEGRQLAGGDHLGDHHGDGLQRLFFLLGIVRRARFCTTSTPSVLPPRRIGTPRKAW